MGISVDHTDFDAVVQGGSTFARRLSDFQSARKSADESLAALNLGRDTKAAYEDAARKRDAAAKELADARARIEEMTRSAKSETDRMRADADAAIQRANQMSASAEAAETQAKKRLADAEAKARLAEALKQQHESAAAGAVAIQAKFHGLVAELQAVMKKV